jgi:hypothetical protein
MEIISILINVNFVYSEMTLSGLSSGLSAFFPRTLITTLLSTIMKRIRVEYFILSVSESDTSIEDEGKLLIAFQEHELQEKGMKSN